MSVFYRSVALFVACMASITFQTMPVMATDSSTLGLCDGGIAIPPEPEAVPESVFDVSFNRAPEEGTPPLEVTLTDTSYGNFVNWSWSFDDGTSASGPSVQHTFSTVGVHTVTLTVTDDTGTTHSSSEEVLVKDIAVVTDADGDGLPDAQESPSCTKSDDADTDDDGIFDGTEDANHNGIVDGGETDPCQADTDGDGLQDGTELGYTLDMIGSDTDLSRFQPDADTTANTDPLLADSNSDGVGDGVEDANHNGIVDTAEAANTPPVAENVSYATDFNVAVTGQLNANDAENSDLIYSIITPGALGSLTAFDARTGAFTYTPNPSVSGIDTITYHVYDGTAYSAPATLTITIKPKWKNYRVGLDMRSDDDGSVGMMFRYQDRKNYYRFEWNLGLGYRRLLKSVNGVFTTLAEDHTAYVVDNTYAVEIVAAGSDLSVKVDGANIFSVADSDLQEGSVALYSWNNAGSYFDNLVVVDLGTGIELVKDDFSSSDLNGWLMVDEGVQMGPSDWSAEAGEFVQRSEIHSLPLDDTGLSKSGTFTLQGQAPVADSGELLVNEDSKQAVSGRLTGHYIVGHQLSFELDQDGNRGHVQITDAATGAYTYTPLPDQSGQDFFTFRVFNGTVYSDATTVSVNIAAQPDAPKAMDDLPQVDEDSTNNIFGVLENDIDPDEDDMLSIVAVGTPSNGGTVDFDETSISYNPPADFSGIDSFTYVISDNTGRQSTATVTVTVLAVDDSPLAQDDNYVVNEDSNNTLRVLANDSDADANDSLTVVEVGSADQGGTLFNYGGSITYAPATNFAGVETFTYTVEDSTGLQSTATVTMTVTPVNDAPLAATDTMSTSINNQVTIDVLANDTDVDGDAIFILAFGQGAHGTVVSRGQDELIYTPATYYKGGDTFSYTISDGHGGTSTTKVTVNVYMDDYADSDNDGIRDGIEIQGFTKFNDADTDDDGILDGVEDANHNGIVDVGETDPFNADTDSDGSQDGYELGYTLSGVGIDTDLTEFTPDNDPTTTTDPLINEGGVMTIINGLLLDNR